MKLSKTWLAAPASLLLMFSAACGNNNESPSASSAAPSSSAPAASASAAPAETPKISIFTTDLAKTAPTSDSDPSIKYMEEKSGIDLDITFLPNSNYVDQLKLKFAANDLPDVYMGFGLTQGDGALDNDLVLPLNDLIDQYGPNLKKNIPQYAWDAVTVNGQIMAIPEPSNTPSSRLFYVRKDWMDNVGITKIPATSDELLDMFRTFRDGDPNKNGQKDEIAFTMREQFSWVGDMIWGMWGISPYEGIELDGEVVPGFLHPNMKEGLRFMQTMYKEGLLDSEFLVNSSSIWVQKIESGIAGSWGQTPANAFAYHKRVADALPNEAVDVITIPTPRGTGYDGPIGSVNFEVSKSYLVMKKAKDPAAVVKFFDWLFSDEGQIFTQIGVEGINYTVDNGEIKYDVNSEVANNTEWRNVFQMHMYNETAFNAKYKDQEREKMQNALNISQSEGLESLTMGMPALGQEIFDLYYEWFEPASRIIVQGADVDATWDKFTKEWRQNGGQEMIDSMTTWVNNSK